MNLYERITAALDAEEATALRRREFLATLTPLSAAQEAHIAAQDPAPTLRRIEALRELVRLHGEEPGTDRCAHCWPGPTSRFVPAPSSAMAQSMHPCPTLRLLARAAGVDPEESADE